MKFKVAVDEAIYAICTYLVEAKTADKARAIIENGEWNKVKLYHQTIMTAMFMRFNLSNP